MKIFENYNKAKQKFGENLAQQAINAKIPSKFIFAACKFNAENGTPFNDLYSLFSQWTTYVAPKNKNVNIDILDYNTFWNTIQDCKKQYEQESKVYDDGTVSITHISSFEQMKNLPIKNLWCIRRGKRWKEYQENGAVFYLIINNNYTDDSNCRYVMVEMYPNGDIGYWSTDNELIDEQGSTRRLPSLAEYQQTLGNALQKIQELHQQVMNNNQLNCNLNMNKKLIRLTESDLHRIVKESVNRFIKENKRRLVRELDDNEQFEDEDDFEWRIDDICAEFGNGEVLINGVLGLWDGKKRIQPTPCSDIRSAIQKCIGRDGEIMSPNDIEFDGETVSLKVCHHDGTNNFEITHYD